MRQQVVFRGGIVPTMLLGALCLACIAFTAVEISEGLLQRHQASEYSRDQYAAPPMHDMPAYLPRPE